MPVVIRANLTAIPQGVDAKSKQRIVLLHISFIKLSTGDSVDPVPMKLYFSDLPVLKTFMNGLGKAPIQLVCRQGQTAVDIGTFMPTVVDDRCWDVMNYKDQQNLKTFFDYRADLAGTQLKINQRRNELDDLIKKLDNEQKRLKNMVDVETGNLKVYEGLINDLGNAESKLAVERAGVSDEALKVQLSALQRRLNRYSTEYATAQSSLAKHNSLFESGKKQLESYKAELKTAKEAVAVLKSFKDDKFIPKNQDDAIDYILGNKTIAVSKSSISSNYTTDVKDENPLSLSDVLGYFSSFPAYQAAMGLQRKLLIPAEKLGTDGTLEVKWSIQDGTGVESVANKVAYEHQADGFFFPKPRPENADRFKRGYLNLQLKVYDKGEKDCFELLQNSYEEIKYRDTGNTDNHSDSDYTSGFFLLQRNSTAALNYKIPQGTFYLEDLVQGYRIDMSRKDGNWHSLHKRSYVIKIKGQRIAADEDDEGFISADSASKAFELVLINGTNNVLADLNLNDLTKDTPDLQISLPAGLRPIYISILFADVFEFTMEEQALLDRAVLKIKKTASPLSGALLDDFVVKVNAALKIKSAEFAHRSVACDLRGRLYYQSMGRYMNSKEDAMPSFLSSSMICHLNGRSLSAPGYVGKEMQEYYNRPLKMELQHLGAFFQYASITHAIELQRGSLPLLRIGDKHSVRCRLVLVGGGSLPASDRNDSAARSQTLLRQDPIGPPRLLMTKSYDRNSGGVLSKFTALGDSESQIIIRGNPTEPKTATRVIAPPSINWQLAEWLKMMDTHDHPDKTIMKETATGNKMPQYASLVETKNKVKVVEWVKGTGRFDAFVDVGASIPYIVDPMAAFFVIEPVRLYSVDTTDSISFSYKDQIKIKLKEAYDAQLKKLTEVFEKKFFTPGKPPACDFWGTKSPENRKANDNTLKCWTLEVKTAIKPGEDINKIETGEVKAELETGIEIDKVRRAVIIKLKPGDDIEFAIRSFTTDTSQLDSLYYGRDKHDLFQKGQPGKVPTVVIAERRFRTIYAVGKPSQNPHLESIDTAAAAGNGIDQFQVDRHSKYPLDVLIYQSILSVGRVCKDVFLAASWEEIVDDVPDEDIEKNGSPLRIVRHFKKVFSYFDKGYYAYGNNVRVEERVFGDEKAASPFVWEAKEQSDDLDLDPGKDDKTFRLYPNMRGKFLAFRHSIGSNKAMLARYRMGGISRFDAYFQEGKDPRNTDLFSAEDTQWFGNKKNGYDFLLKATEIPQSPKVFSITPLFDTNKPNDKIFKGVRVHLERPWYSSGYAEQLAVIVQITEDNSDVAAQYVSQVGRDSVTKEAGLNGKSIILPLPTDFALTLPGTGKFVKAKICNFPVQFDKRNKRWFSDIPIDRGDIKSAYCPFVKLVIARFQPNAVAGKELSLPVACDFFQIYPERTVSAGGANGTTIKISAPALRKGVDDKGNEVLLTQIVYWKVGNKNAMAQHLQGYRFDHAETLGAPDPARYDGNGNFIIDYGTASIQAVIIKEFELYANSNNDIRTRRLLYSYVITINQQ